jgi:hypothetical protein
VVRFALGLVVGVALGAGGTWFFLRKHDGGGGAKLAAATPDAGVDPKAKKPAKRRGYGGGGGRGGGMARSAADDDAPIPELGPDDLRMISDGDSLALGTRKMDLAADAPEPRDLTQDEIDGGVSPRSGAIIKCITDARGNAPVNGQIVVKFVVVSTGNVTQTRVEAPAYLMKHGLSGCVRPQLRAMRFPATGKDSVLTVPFDLS